MLVLGRPFRRRDPASQRARHILCRDFAWPDRETPASGKTPRLEIPWVSSGGNTFNYDFAVSFEPDANGEALYNYEKQKVPFKDLQGVSIFVKGEDGAIYHAYSTYGRGQDILNGAYNILDMTPKGRDEDKLPYPMAWVRFNDEYETA